jgi:hypothetical protein
MTAKINFVKCSYGIVQIKQIMELIAKSKQASFLAVLKEFGDIKSKGMLSFPRPGITLALDFPYNGKTSIDLIKTLTEIVNAHGGRLYPAKDSFMTQADFSLYYKDEIEVFRHFVDPVFSSNFWRRTNSES